MSEMTCVLQADRLCKTYTQGGLHVSVLDNLNLTVTPGELVAIVGSSGVGKTTLLQLLGGLDQPSSGHVFVCGKDFGQLSATEKGKLRNQSLGFVYQFHHLLPEFNALENVCLPLLIGGASPAHAKEKAGYYIEQVGLTHRLKHRVGELSGGERQRIALARALVTQPKCVLADEPTGNLDETTGMHVAELLISLSELFKISFVVVTHNKLLAHKMHRTLILEGGRLQRE